jgi:hypothetical protein
MMDIIQLNDSIDRLFMGKYAKLLIKIFAGSIDSNIEFSSLCQLLLRLGFEKRVKDDHHIFTRSDIAEIINIQPKRHKA